MSETPLVSIAMSVHNGGPDLTDAVESILTQEGVAFEFIIVDDGSTDDSGNVLANYAAKDLRVRLIQQTNMGLTRSLINACALARGKYIARQDADDVALPGRLREQVATAESHPEASMVSCATRFVGPRGEKLYDSIIPPGDRTDLLLTTELGELRGPSSHGATLFRAESYRHVGGYRQQFRVAQDVDLWVRLAEVGRHQVIGEVLQETKYSLAGVSSGRWNRQMAAGALIIESAVRRRRGEDDRDVLDAAAIQTSGGASNTRSDLASAAYFVGSCLVRQRNRAARTYLFRAIRTRPWHFRAWIRLAQSLINT